MNVWINGNEYVLRPSTKVTASPVPDFAEQYRTVGRQQRADRSGISSWEFSDTSKGLGVKNMAINDANDAKSIYDSLAWTHIPGQWTPPAMFLTPSIHAAAAHSKVTHIFAWQNGLYGLVQPSGAPIGSANVFQYTAANNNFDGSLGPLARVASIGGTTPGMDKLLDLRVSQNRIYSVSRSAVVNDSSVIGVFETEGVGSFAYHYHVGSPGVGTLPVSGQLIVQGSLGKPLLMLSTPSHSMLMVPSGVPIRSAVIQGTTSLFHHNTASMAFLGIPSAHELYNSPMTTWGEELLFVVPDGLYQTGLTQHDKLLDWYNAPEYNPQVANYRDLIYCKVGNQLIEYNPSNNDIRDVGFTRRDGLPRTLNEQPDIRYALTGEITALYPSWKYLFVGIKPVNNGLSTIMAYDGDNDAWHLMARCPSVGLSVNRMFLSSVPDGAERLWVIWRNWQNSHNNEYPSFFFNPLTNPLSAPTHAYATYGRIVWPNFDGGLPDVKGVWAGFGLDSESVGSLHRVELLLQPDHTPSLHVVGTTHTTPYYARIKGGAGMVANAVMPYLELYRGTTAATAPVIRTFTMDYLKVPSTRMSYEFEVDVQLTADKTARDREKVISDLESVRDFTSEIPTFWYGRIGTRRVIVPPGNIVNLEETLPTRDFPGERNVNVKMKLQELV